MNAVRTTLGVLCIAVIAVCVALIGIRLAGNARLADLTEHNLYVLSDGTKAVLGKLNQPVTLKLYYSRTAALKGTENIRYFNNYYRYVRALLEEYVRLSGGQLRLEVIDPRPFTNEEQAAMEYGVKLLPITEDESFAFGLVAATELGKHKVIDLFQPERQELVEYDVTKVIAELMQRDRLAVGVLSSMPVAGEELSPYLVQMMQMQGQTPPAPWVVVQHLRQAYDIKPVEVKDGRLSQDVDFLLVVHPKEFDRQALFAIDQHVMAGGQLLVFVDPYCYADQPPSDPRNPYASMARHDPTSQLNMLLERWGVSMEAGQIAADRALGMSPGQQGNRMAARLPTLMMLTGQAPFNRTHPITRGLDQVKLFMAGVLRRTEPVGTTIEPLLQTTAPGATWRPGNPYELRSPDGEAIGRQLVETAEPVMLACIITGPMTTNFPNGLLLADSGEDADDPAGEAQAPTTDPATRPADGEPATRADTQPAPKTRRVEAIPTAAEGARVIVVADVDVISDMLAYQPTMFGMAQWGGNAPFVLNALDYLAGSGDLIAIRTRGQFARPFDRVDRIEELAARNTQDKVQEVQQRIAEYQAKLSQLGGGATPENMFLIENQAVQARRALEAELQAANRELRMLQVQRRQEVEQLGQRCQTLNMVAAPGALLLIAIVLAVIRYARARRYAARRVEP